MTWITLEQTPAKARHAPVRVQVRPMGGRGTRMGIGVMLAPRVTELAGFAKGTEVVIELGAGAQAGLLRVVPRSPGYPLFTLSGGEVLHARAPLPAEGWPRTRTETLACDQWSAMPGQVLVTLPPSLCPASAPAPVSSAGKFEPQEPFVVLPAEAPEPSAAVPITPAPSEAAAAPAADLRAEAWELFGLGYDPRAVAEELGVKVRQASGWLVEYRAQRKAAA